MSTESAPDRVGSEPSDATEVTGGSAVPTDTEVQRNPEALPSVVEAASTAEPGVTASGSGGEAESAPPAAAAVPEPPAADAEPEPPAADAEPEPPAADAEPEPPAVAAEPEPPAADAEPAPPAVAAEPAPPAADAEPAPPAVAAEPAPPAAPEPPVVTAPPVAAPPPNPYARLMGTAHTVPAAAPAPVAPPAPGPERAVPPPAPVQPAAEAALAPAPAPAPVADVPSPLPAVAAASPGGPAPAVVPPPAPWSPAPPPAATSPAPWAPPAAAAPPAPQPPDDAGRDIIREGPRQAGTALARSAEDVAGWYWCPTHLIASERAGTCAGCGQPLQPAPPWGIPQGPYTPVVQVHQRTRRERITYAAAAAVLVLAAVAAILGVTTLWRHGTPLDATGQPQASDSGAPAGSASGVGASSDNTTPVTITALDSRQLVLNGKWQTTRQVYTVMIELAKQLNGGTTLAPEVAAGKGASRLVVYNVPSSNPGQTVTENTQSTSDSSADTSGTVSVGASRQVTVEGHPAWATDIERRDTSGRVVLNLRYYLVPTSNHVVMVAIGTDGSNDDLQSVSAAIEALH